MEPKFTWKVNKENVEFYCNSILIHKGTTKETHTIQVILWIRQNLHLGLADAKKLWDDMITKYGQPLYNGPSRVELEEIEAKRQEALSKLKPLTKKELEELATGCDVEEKPDSSKDWIN